MRLFLFLLALLAPLVPLHAQTRLAPDAETQWVPFELTRGNQIRFTMTLNGHAARAVLDTGVSDSIVSARFATQAGLKPGAATRAQAIGGVVDVRWATTDKLVIGGLTREGGRIGIADLDPVTIGGGATLDLLIGNDLLSCCAVEIDFDAKRFRLLHSGRLPFRGATMPLARVPRLRAYASEARLGERAVRPLIVDTGDGSMLTLSHAAWQAAGARPNATTSTMAFGAGGPIETELAVLPEVRLGTLTARDIEVRIEDGEGFSTRTGTAGRIGTGLLQRYHVLIDPGAKRMVLAPGAKAETPPVRSTSGLLLGYQNNELRVLHVMRNSPAAEGGWKAGELICTIDGVPVPRGAGADIDAEWTVGTPGRVVRLGLCDGTERALMLRRFY